MRTCRFTDLQVLFWLVRGIKGDYASNLLHNDVPVQHVAEALGHRGLAAVHRYLSLEEQRMCLCGLSLHDRGLTIERGLCHM